MLHQLFPQTLDIHGPATGEMANGFTALSRANQSSGTTHRHLSRRPLQRRVARRTSRWESNGTRIGGPSLSQHPNHLRNYVTGSAYHHGIPDPDTQAVDFIGIVQRRIGHRDPTHEHRIQPGHRRQNTGTANLKLHRFELGRRLLRRKLAGNRPTRRSRYRTETALVLNTIHLEHGTVDRVIERPALRRESLEVLDCGLDARRNSE